MSKSKKKVAVDKSKVSEDKAKEEAAAEVVEEEDMSKSREEPMCDTEPQPTVLAAVGKDGSSKDDSSPVKRYGSDNVHAETKKISPNDDDNDNNKSSSKKNDHKSSDNTSTAKKVEGGIAKEVVVEETVGSPKNPTDASSKTKKNGDVTKKCAKNIEVEAVEKAKQDNIATTYGKQQMEEKKIDNSQSSSSKEQQSTTKDDGTTTSTTAASRTSSSNPATNSTKNTTSSSNVTSSTAAVQNHAQQLTRPTHHTHTHSSSAAAAAVAQQPKTTTQYTSPSDLDDDDDDDGYSDANDTLLTMSFNQDGGCLAVGTGSGFRICNVHPFEENLRRTLGGDNGNGGGGNNNEGGGLPRNNNNSNNNNNGGGIAHIEMLYRTNLLAITGSSSSRQFPPNKVLMYDDHYQRTIGELNFRQRVLTTRLRRDRIVVVLRDRTYIYNFADMTLLDKVYTGDNPLGLIGISLDNGGVGGSTTTGVVAENAGSSSSQQQRNNGMVLAFPSKQQGQVRVELYGLRRSTVVNAHESSLGALALSIDGSLLATASERGTVIRLFDTRGVTIGGGGSGVSSSSSTQQGTTTASSVSSSVPLREFRRGVDRATISCLTFSLDSSWLGCASDHGTVHIFQTYDPNNNSSDKKKKTTRSSSMTGKAIRMLPKLVTAPKKYIGMDGVHSYAQVRGVPHPHACAFVPDREQTIAVAGMDEYGNGCLLLAEFGSKSNTTSDGGGGGLSSGDDGGEGTVMDDTEARRVGYHRFFKSKSPSSQIGSSRRRTKSKDCKIADDTLIEGGAYIDDTPIDLRMDHISIGDENEDHFVPIDYNMGK